MASLVNIMATIVEHRSRDKRLNAKTGYSLQIGPAKTRLTLQGSALLTDLLLKQRRLTGPRFSA
jgi:hypothetical protein